MSMKHRAHNHNKEQGFTIVELMIALSVLSTILVMVAMILTQIGFTYTKGVNSTNLQNTNRNIVADLSSTLQFDTYAPVDCASATPSCQPNYCTLISLTCYTPDPGNGFGAPRRIGNFTIYAYCIGTTRYSYVLNDELGTGGGEIAHVLWRDTMTNTGDCSSLDLTQPNPSAGANSTGGYEMTGNNMSLRRFNVYSTGSGVYNISVWMTFGDISTLLNGPDRGGNATCKGAVGDQFCATSNIDTSVTRRI